jgi:uncharacterized protein YkwD
MSTARPSSVRTRSGAPFLVAAAACVAGSIWIAPAANADNKRLNDGVFADVYAIHDQAGCATAVRIDPRLQLAAQWHTADLLNNRNLDADIGSDGSTPPDRANTAGFHGTVAETVAINPALAISGLELINQWYYNSAYLSIMSDCANTAIGVWSENSLDRTVVVAVYGHPTGADGDGNSSAQTGGIDPTPDYNASDEIEYGVNWLPWILRGVYPPPAYPPQ